MKALCCPHCGHVLFVIGEGAPGELPAARPAEAGRDEASAMPSTSFREGKWRIECPEHGWHIAKLWAASGGKPAVVKCTGQDESTGEFCNAKVPAAEAKRRAGVVK